METTIPLTADIIVKLIGLFLGFCLVLYWAASSTMKKSKNDWDAFHKLKKKANDALTLKEIEEVHKELQEFGKKVYNQYIHAELHQVDGYLRGMYKVLKQENAITYSSDEAEKVLFTHWVFHNCTYDVGDYYYLDKKFENLHELYGYFNKHVKGTLL